MSTINQSINLFTSDHMDPYHNKEKKIQGNDKTKEKTLKRKDKKN